MQHYATLCHVVGAQDRVRQIFSSKSEIPLYHGNWSQEISDSLFVTLFSNCFFIKFASTCLAHHQIFIFVSTFLVALVAAFLSIYCRHRIKFEASGGGSEPETAGILSDGQPENGGVKIWVRGVLFGRFAHPR